MASLDIQTYEDAVDHVCDVFDVDKPNFATSQGGGPPFRRALRSVQRAYKFFGSRHRWAYLERRANIRTIAAQDDGTIQYTHEGGTFPRELKITGATWPNDPEIRIFKVILEQNQFDIEDYKDPNTLTLSSTNSPRKDIDAGSSYTLYKSRFLLPINFRRMNTRLLDLTRSFSLGYVSPSQLLRYQMGQWQPQEPFVYTIFGENEYYGALLCEMAPPPNVDRLWEFVYDAAMRPLRYYRVSSGTVTTDASSTVIFSDAILKPKHVGSIFRLSVNANPPGGIIGGIADGSEVEPFETQRTLVEVVDSNTGRLDEPVTQSGSFGFSISDPLDMPIFYTTEAFLHLCESEFASMSNRDDRDDYEVRAQRAVVNAMAFDNRQRDIQDDTSSDKSQWGLAEWALSEPFSGQSISGY